MEEWKIYKLGEITSKIGSGATPKGGRDSYLGGNISLIRSQNVLDFSFSKSGLAYINEMQAEKLNNVEVYEKDVLLNITGDSVARVCIVPNNVLPARVNQHVAIIRGNEKVDYRYLLYYLQYIKPQLLSLSQGGATRNALTKKMIEELEIKMPSKGTQKEIVSILYTLDTKIALNRRINDNLEQQAQALFAEIFESDYTFAQLGAVIETCSGGTPSRNNLDYYIDGTICWVKSKELNRSFLFDTEEKIAQVGIDKSSAKLLPKNSVLIAMYGATVGEYCIIDKPMTCNQAICALLPSSDYPASYLYMFVKQKRNELINLAVGSAQQNISQVLIKGLSVSANLKLIAKFDKMVMPIFNMIRKNAKESIILEAERNTLLPRLMSGELKINDLNS